MLKLNKLPELPKTIVVDYEGAKFHFRIPNDLDKFDLLTATKTSERIRVTFNTLVKVENVVDENDKPISYDAVLDLLTVEQITKIMLDRNDQLQKLHHQVEAETKNS